MTPHRFEPRRPAGWSPLVDDVRQVEGDSGQGASRPRPGSEDTVLDSNQTPYVPVLKCKRGEFWSLANLRPGSLDRIVPLMEVVKPPMPKPGSPPKTEEALPAAGR
jgi:hypothetical protein